jgi:integrase
MLTTDIGYILHCFNRVKCILLNNHKPPEAPVNNFLPELKAKIDGFIQSRKDDNQSKNSIDHYLNVMTYYYMICANLGAKNYREGLSMFTNYYREHVSKDTVSRYLAAIRTFMNWANTGVKISVKRVKSIPRAKSLPHVSAVLSVVDMETRILLHTILDTGLRIGSVIMITPSCIDFDEHTITITGKGDSICVVGFGETTEKELRFLAAYRGPNDRLFPGTNTKWRKRIEHACEGCDFDKFAFHVLRHTFAKWFLRHGSGQAMLQAALNHASPQTSMIYAKCFSSESAALQRRLSIVDKMTRGEYVGPSRSEAAPVASHEMVGGVV